VPRAGQRFTLGRTILVAHLGSRIAKIKPFNGLTETERSHAVGDCPERARKKSTSRRGAWRAEIEKGALLPNGDFGGTDVGNCGRFSLIPGTLDTLDGADTAVRGHLLRAGRASFVGRLRRSNTCIVFSLKFDARGIRNTRAIDLRNSTQTDLHRLFDHGVCASPEDFRRQINRKENIQWLSRLDRRCRGKRPFAVGKFTSSYQLS
jgi:hypothetical protein